MKLRVHTNTGDGQQFIISSTERTMDEGDDRDISWQFRPEASRDGVAHAPSTIAFNTDTSGSVPVDVEFLETPPTLSLEKWDDVFETSIDICSGRLHVLESAGCGRMDAVKTFEVEPGNYVIRVFSRGLSKTAYLFDQDGKYWFSEEYLLQLWPGPVIERTVLKRFVRRQRIERVRSSQLFFLLLAGLFILFGIYSLVHPTEAYVPPRLAGEHVTKFEARIYGVIWIALGTVMGCVTIRRKYHL